jgi:vacuolar-type H+-ATPase catalytic subunit A/Vma1
MLKIDDLINKEFLKQNADVIVETGGAIPPIFLMYLNILKYNEQMRKNQTLKQQIKYMRNNIRQAAHDGKYDEYNLYIMEKWVSEHPEFEDALFKDKVKEFKQNPDFDKNYAGG